MTRPAKAPITVRRLASILGVSATTVSLALRGSPRLTARTRRRVRAAAARHGYVPNARLSELMTELRLTRDRSYTGTLALLGFYRDSMPWHHYPHLKRIADGARRAAKIHGYILEEFGMDQAGLGARRLKSILEARNVSGIFCVGAERAGLELPAALSNFVVVTQGVSIAGEINRVMSHFGEDCARVLNELLDRGYRRPGLVIDPEGDERTNFEYSNTYLGVCDRILPGQRIPVLRSPRFSPKVFDRWYRRNRPDVLVVHQRPESVRDLLSHLGDLGLECPRSIGLAILGSVVEPDPCSGIRQDFERIGAGAVEMLIERVALASIMPRRPPKIEVVEGTWQEGRTLRPRMIPPRAVPRVAWTAARR
jgi:LacI family transcriptional regulator